MKDIGLYTENQPYILAMEDADRSTLFKNRWDDDRGITMNCLLNAIDGLVESHGRLLFITALLRPGRIDKEVNIDLCDYDQLQRMFIHCCSISFSHMHALRTHIGRGDNFDPQFQHMKNNITRWQ
uniref:Uncharacterized protein n=1 Tax=viral metagenome TaxID=1070528 RepID=A0A6C0IUY4_9ZZZZ